LATAPVTTPTTVLTSPTAFPAPMAFPTTTTANLIINGFHEFNVPGLSPNHDEYVSNLVATMAAQNAKANKTVKDMSKAVHSFIQYNSTRISDVARGKLFIMKIRDSLYIKFSS
jgi:hypothetical protein